jgi:signal transduction histidine kinase
MKIQTKTAWLFTGLTAGIMFLLVVLVYFLAQRFTFQDFRKRLQLRAVMAAKVNLEQDETSTAVFSEIQRQHLEVLPDQKEYIFLADSVTGDVQLNNELRLPTEFYRAVFTNGEAFYDKGPTTYAGIYYPDNQGNFIVVASAKNEYGTQTLKNLRTVFLVCMFVGMCIAFSVGLFFSRKTFEPVRNIVARIKRITAQNLHLRLPETNRKDEIGELAHTFNNMLDRLETAFETQNNFISHASHELHTPLTTIIGEAELAISRERKPEEYEAALHIILQEAERLSQLTAGLLSLAQTGFSTKLQMQELLRIDELLRDVKTMLERMEPGCRLQIRFDKLPADETWLQLKGDRQLLMLAFSNIVMNGCKYSGNQPVTIHLSLQQKNIKLVFTDQGIGIPEKELPKIFDPFFRASNTGKFKGYGIGLPLVATILRLHHATIQVQSTEGSGTQVILLFPMAE